MQKKCNRFFGVYTLLLGLFACFSIPGFAQGLINNGANIIITNTSSIYISGSTGHFTNQSGGLIVNNSAGGTITLGGNWTNNAANTVFSNDGSTVVFNASTAQSIAGTNGTGFYNLTASGTGTKTFNTSSTASRLVTVSDNTTLNANGNLTLLGYASSHASIGPLLNGATVTNNVIVQSYLTGGSEVNRGSRGMSSPINDALVGGDKTYKQLQSKLIVTGPGGPSNGFDLGNAWSPYALTIKTYNEPAIAGTAQFTNAATINEATTPGKGFFFFYRGSRFSNYDNSGASATGSKVVSPYAIPESVTIDYTGPVNQGAVPVNLSYTDHGDSDIYTGYNLVGNPYPSVIDLEAVRAASTGSIAPFFYILRPDGLYALYNSDDPNLSTNSATRYVIPGQAFYVKANATGQVINFTESCKDPYPSSGSPMRFLSITNSDFNNSVKSNISTSSSATKVLRLKLENSIAAEEIILAFKSNSNAKFINNEDAPSFSGPVSLSSKSEDGKNLTLNCLPEPDKASEISLTIGTANPGQHSLVFTKVPELGNTQIFLKDSYLNKSQNITEGLSYDLTIDRDKPESTGANRLKLIFRPEIKSPEFLAKKVYGGSEVMWSEIESETTGKYILERSQDGKTYEAIGSINKSALSEKPSYTFLDSKPGEGINYYRLKVIANDSLYSYTNVVELDYSVDKNEPNFRIYPNPVKEDLNVSFKQIAQMATFDIYDLGGNKIKTFSVSECSRITYKISDLQTGIYVLKVTNNQNQELGTEKFIKE